VTTKVIVETAPSPTGAATPALGDRELIATLTVDEIHAVAEAFREIRREAEACDLPSSLAVGYRSSLEACDLPRRRRSAADTTDKIVLEALCVVRAHAIWEFNFAADPGVADEAVPFYASVRLLAEMTGYAPMTCANSLRRLRRRGTLRRLRRHSGAMAAEYQLAGVPVVGRPKPKGSALVHNVVSPRGRRVQVRTASAPAGRRVTDLAPDVWRSDALGHAASVAYGCLTAQPQTVKAIAEQADRQPNGVRKHLRKLERHGLASRAGRAWVRGATSLDAAAGELGVAGSNAKRRSKHAAERAYRAEAMRRERARRRGIDPDTGEVLSSHPADTTVIDTVSRAWPWTTDTVVDACPDKTRRRER